ncbi:DUF4386 family protein [Colwellia sp. D2M02]|uniref:DUF4386 family protein n=1 Tax=Colwellia sp. D2M02 TaxID=2841562 RepID=UPI001C091BC5|nr:DUF4386 family protein [Colwellia sp. D2M02]MBU2892472.1 DUF4386 family protein [Colwellia sp. D2M02]
MTHLQKLAGVAAIAEGLIYIIAFIYFGTFFTYPINGSPVEKITYLAEVQLTFSLVCLLMYVVFGVFLALLVVGLHERIKHTNTPTIFIGSLFGVIWVGLVIASGMLSNIGLAHAIELANKSPEKALELWTTISVITESLGGGNEVVGGLWVLLVSIAAMKGNCLPRFINFLGCFVGMAGIATIYPNDTFTEIFGVSQIVWFIGLGLYLLSEKKAQMTQTNKTARL